MVLLFTAPFASLQRRVLLAVDFVLNFNEALTAGTASSTDQGLDGPGAATTASAAAVSPVTRCVTEGVLIVPLAALACAPDGRARILPASTSAAAKVVAASSAETTASGRRGGASGTASRRVVQRSSSTAGTDGSGGTATTVISARSPGSASPRANYSEHGVASTGSIRTVASRLALLASESSGTGAELD